MQNIKIIPTDSGDFTLYRPDIDEHYHSTHGAIAEAQHVYIQHGLNQMNKSPLNLLEIGFGTGLNAFLSAIFAFENNIKINYTGIEKFPLTPTLLKQLNYARFFPTYSHLWDKIIQQQSFNTSNFNFQLKIEDIAQADFTQKFDLIYYDAFAPDKQPEMWTEKFLAKVSKQLNSGGILTTYTAKGTVKQALRNIGLTVKRLPGALGKHHMINALKP